MTIPDLSATQPPSAPGGCGFAWRGRRTRPKQRWLAACSACSCSPSSCRWARPRFDNACWRGWPVNCDMRTASMWCYCLVPAFFFAGAIRGLHQSVTLVMTYLGPAAHQAAAYGVAVGVRLASLAAAPTGGRWITARDGREE